MADSARIHFDEATWERILESHNEGSVLEHVASNQAQPPARIELSDGELHAAVLKALNKLPLDEANAIYERLGLGKGTGKIKFTDMEIGGDPETAKLLYKKGVRRLKRRVSDPKYPELKALERIFNEWKPLSVVGQADI